MSLSKDAMGLGLRALNRFAGMPLIDRLRLRKPAERAIYHGARMGFIAAGAANRSFRSTQQLFKPARLSAGGRRSLFDLEPSEDQQMLREAALGYALEQMRPAAPASDTACATSADILAGIADLGLAQLSVPEELGGVGSERSATTSVLIAEALAQGDMGIAVAALAPTAVSTALVLWGNAEQQARYLPSFVAEQTPAAALSVLEPQPLFDPFSLQTVARQVDGGFEISGVKSLVPRGAEAELFIVAAQRDGAGPALFLVESSSQGLGIAAEPAMGLRAAATARLHLDRVTVPASALLAEGDDYRDCIRLARLGWCALAVGTAQAAVDYVIPYVNEREAFGEPISHRQSVAFSVADMATELEGLRLMTWRAASRAEQGLPFARETALARRMCADRAVVIGSDAVQLLGGHGFVKEHPVERWFRDLRAAGLMEGVVLV